jgi:hypothetical protein
MHGAGLQQAAAAGNPAAARPGGASATAAPITRPARWKFFGPAFVISIGYFDPGNWATDLQAGSQFG